MSLVIALAAGIGAVLGAFALTVYIAYKNRAIM